MVHVLHAHVLPFFRRDTSTPPLFDKRWQACFCFLSLLALRRVLPSYSGFLTARLGPLAESVLKRSKLGSLVMLRALVVCAHAACSQIFLLCRAPFRYAGNIPQKILPFSWFLFPSFESMEQPGCRSLGLSLSPLDDYPPGATRHDPSSSIFGLNQKVKHGTRSWSRSSPLAKAGLRCTLTLDHERAPSYHSSYPRELGCRSIDACRG